MPQSGSAAKTTPRKDIASLRQGLQKLRTHNFTQPISRSDIANMQSILQKLKFEVAPEEISKQELGTTTSAAIQQFQTQAGLQPSGNLDPDTIDRLNLELQHVFFTTNKGRIEKLQASLARLGFTIAADEVQRHVFGPGTQNALKAFETKVHLPVDGQVTEALMNRLQEEVLKERLGSKTQASQFQHTLVRALGIAKLNLTIDPHELKQKELGPTTTAALNAFQQKYRLPVSGQFDPATLERMQSVVTSRPGAMKALKVQQAAKVTPVTRVLRLNMQNEHVAALQQALAFMGFSINEQEFKTHAFGKTTRAAIIAYQRRNGLPVTGHVSGPTRASLNREIGQINPSAVQHEYAYRVRGSVRDELWRGVSGLKVQVLEKTLRGSGSPLGERTTRQNGFFDLPYDPPRDPATQQIKSPFHLQVQVLDRQNAVQHTKVLFNPSRIAWVNFTAGDQPYRGRSEFDERMQAIGKALGNLSIADIVETPQQQEITHVALNARLAQDDVMRLALAQRAARKLGNAAITAPVFYAYIRQNLPSQLPSDLLHSSVDWTLIEQLVDKAINGLVFMDAELQSQAFDNALAENLIPIEVGRQKPAILAALAQLKTSFVLEKPLLAGNGSLQTLLQASAIPPATHTAVATAFLGHRGLGDDFWNELKAHPADFGGAAAVSDFETTIYVGQIAKNDIDTVRFLKGKIADAATTHISSARDLAKLTHADWINLINQNGGKVPEGTDGTTPQEQIANYASILATQSERLFPTVAFVAEARRAADAGAITLQKTGQIAALIDAQPDLDLHSVNLDAYIRDRQLNVDPQTLAEARVMQRVQRITPSAAIGRVLLENKIHSSAQIVRMGRDGFMSTLQGQQIDSRTALTVYNYAEFQYAHALALLTDYRYELHRSDPQAIVRYTYTPAETQALLGNIPNLETLFGTLDFCDCPHCQSVYGPAAYLADVLRFLDSHPSQQPNKTVRAILFDRRPDIGNLKLNCDNSEVPLPYIDLVCEILEHAVPAPAADPDFSFQTTATPEELRAFAQNVRKEAYDLLKNADFPLNSGFNLWQEEARIYLQHLGLSRAGLMQAFQARPSSGTPTPADLSIAGEFWGISTHETGLITNAAATPAAQSNFWGFDATQTSIVVSTFLDHARISYADLLALLNVQWLNPANDPNRMVIERPVDTFDIEKQHLTQLSVDRLDRMHRLLRLWGHTTWTLWQLDLLIRAPRIGNSRLDAGTLVQLQQFRQVADRLGLDFETALSFYHQINIEFRPQPDVPQRTVPPLYITLFQNPAVINPIDPAFALPLASNPPLAAHRPTLLAALAIGEAELDLLLARLPDGRLNLSNLTRLYNLTLLAGSLSLRVAELLGMLDLAGVTDPFASPGATLEFSEACRLIGDSKLAAGELDYLLNFRPDSPYGLRVEAITQSIEALRESLRTSTATTLEGQIAAQVATIFGLSNDQAQILLTRLALGGTLMDNLMDLRLTARDAGGQYITAISEANFPNIYATFRLMHKVALLVQRYKLARAEELAWLLSSHAQLAILDLNALPVTGAPTGSLFPAWLAFHKLLQFKAQYPEPEESSLSLVIDIASDMSHPLDDILQALSTLTTWSVADLQALHTGLQLERGSATVPSAYLRVDTYLRLAACLQMARRTGVGAATLLQWAQRDTETGDQQFTTARQVKQAAKSRHDYATWLKIATPFEDTLREKKRTALVEYLVAHSLRSEPTTIDVNGNSFANPRYWKDASDLLGYFLIDIEMGACQLTSRIKQAMSSVQMFVQRCFLNLEQPAVEVSKAELGDQVSLNSWKQWQWIKSYRVWEANRKVFLYPENWIDPTLRDDKSPFFVELENDLTQNDITAETAEAAFRQYVEKVHEVARLEITGIYHELDDDNPSDNLPPNINVVHVVGRTRAQPAIYYYRRFDVNYNTWSAWEKIDLDITGDHVIPVVYNRKLYLFWLNFLQKPQQVKKQPPAKASDTPVDSPEPLQQLEIQMAWSQRKQQGWTTKQVSHQKLIHPWARPLYSYHLKPRYKSRENLLWLDIYISTSEPFNNSLFYDPYRNTRTFLTSFRYSETARPWHSSSFVFDGQVVDLKMKGLSGSYHIQDQQGGGSDALVATTSYQYIHESFGEAGRAINQLTGGYEIAPRLLQPDGMHYKYSALANNTTQLNASRFNVLESGASKTLLAGAKSPFTLVFSQHTIQFDTARPGSEPLVYQDPYRSFFIKPEWQELILGSSQVLQQLKYTFFPFYHPYSALFLRELGRSGTDGLLSRAIQVAPQSYYPGNSFSFSGVYQPTTAGQPDASAQTEIVDFNRYGAYALYNWEIFFHVPFMIANKLGQNQRFAEALQWYHYIFDPTNIEAVGVPQRFWVTRPFYEMNSEDYRKQRIENLLRNIGANLDQIRAWKNHPFKPDLIAHYRPVTYQKAVVMKYIDTLIAWGDQLFRQDTIEAINEATTLYILAYELLGRRPVQVPDTAHTDLSYNELAAQGSLDPLGNAQVEVLMENFAGAPVQVVRSSGSAEALPTLDVDYFAIPNNDKLLGYWTTLEDRLFKIRNCMNITGVVRQLPLFEPPLDPALLVKAAAEGVDLASVLNDVTVAPGQYHFRLLVQRALELAAEVRALGEKLLSAQEKRDAEGLALLRSLNEINLQTAIKQIRQDQVSEASHTEAALEKSKALAEERKGYYEGRDFMNPAEITATGLGLLATLAETAIAYGYNMAGGLALIPKFTAGTSGFGGSPHVTGDPVDGLHFSRAAEAAVQTLSSYARALEKWSALSASMAGYQRRQEEWDFQGRLATLESQQIDQQITAAQIRMAIASKELENQQLQIDQARAVDEYMRSKYSNSQLYDWMLNQLTTIYFQGYQLAYDMAKRAEKSFQLELSQPGASFIQFGYWDSLKQGLLSGERLANDLHRMESAYYDRNTRLLEITRHISLAQVAPLSLVRLKETGACTVRLPEWLFDLDYPGHYIRRIRSVAISIPCVVGPYTSVNCTLALTNHGMRLTDDVAAGYGDPLAPADDRFWKSPVPVQSIATSHAQNDAGMFELSFNDERFLPFEGAGAVSEWSISLPREHNLFDFDSIADVILHLRYTAVSGSTALVQAAQANLDAVLPTSGVRLLVLNQEFSNEWYRFLHPAGTGDQVLEMTLKPEHLPFFARNRTARLKALDLIIDSPRTGNFDARLQFPGASQPSDEVVAPDQSMGGVQHLALAQVVPASSVLGTWRLQLRNSGAPDFRSLQPEDVPNAYLVINFDLL